MLILYVKKEESVKEYPLNLTGPLDIKALPGHCYTLRDPDTGQAPEGMVIKRLGDDLEIRVNDTPVVTLARFFQEDDPDPSVFSTDGSYAPPEEMMVSGDAPAP
ncbi:MAG: hypothetical protein MI799_00330, partial [Desulfobacterales bacterium]|nr:hypothetical protein [Desulfobacterales bacterium]